MLIEIAVFSLEAALAAANAGAHRIELCSAPAEGGLTPSAATMRLTRKYVKIPVYVMIRPREGDFCYTDKEFETMLLDVTAAKFIGMEGVVTGVLNSDGTIDEERMAILVETAAPMNVTFHRAFDMARDQTEALEAVIRTGCARVLSSGALPTAEQGAENLADLVKKADNRISIMPGCGVNKKNITQIATLTGAKEIHLSARIFVPGLMKFKHPLVTMGSTVSIPDYDVQLPDENTIKDILNLFS